MCVDRWMAGQSSQSFIFRIVSPASTPMEIAAESEEDLLDWMRCIRECTNMAEQKVCRKIQHLLDV